MWEKQGVLLSSSSDRCPCGGLLLNICCRADNAEVELVSLIEEHIPHYKLRADTLTEFGVPSLILRCHLVSCCNNLKFENRALASYENEDWYIRTPVLSPDTDIPLSPEVVEETLKYFGNHDLQNFNMFLYFTSYLHAFQNLNTET
ncbi:UNVERIFIED_CONTAM: hypothetical protein NCL1_47734 [Trichonephila clavipes]